MKKLFFVGVFTLTSLAACQNESNEVFEKNENKGQKIEQQSRTSLDIVTGKASDEAVLNSVNELFIASRLPGGGAQIMCHTNYLADSGSACVYNGGYMFQVTWGTEWVYEPKTGQFIDQTVWHSNSVHSCGC